MTRAKLKVDLRQQLLEVEGTDAFVTRMLKAFEGLVAARPAADWTRLVAANWVHGAEYGAADARRLLEEVGLTLQFSRSLSSASVTAGVLDVQVNEGSAGLVRHVEVRDVRFDPLPEGAAHGLTAHFDRGESFDPGDQIVVALRGGYLRDVQGRPVDLSQFGVATELIPGGPAPRKRPASPAAAAAPPAALTGVFESWFWVAQQ